MTASLKTLAIRTLALTTFAVTVMTSANAAVFIRTRVWVAPVVAATAVVTSPRWCTCPPSALCRCPS